MKKIASFIVILMSLFIVTVHGQERNLEVSGTVYDATFNDPLPGVSIFIKTAPGVGTITDANGNFTIRVARRETLVFQMIGMAKVERLIERSESNIRIELKEDTKLLDEVVITGLTSQKKVSIVGAITSVDVEELKTPATSLNNMIGGRVAGVMTSMVSGEPGQNISNFWIRGIGTFGASDGALVLIDGLEGRLQDIDPDDVQSFQILKDASATAVYGVRGANGVVLITTKRGHTGKLQITARATAQVNQIKRLPQYLGAYDYAMLANEARAMSGSPDIYTKLDLDVIKNGLDPDLYPDVNWMEEIMKTASFKHRYYMSAKGGGDVAQYFVSLGGQFENAAYNQADVKFKSPVTYNTINYRANIDMKLTPKTKLYFGTEGNIIGKTLPGREHTNSLWEAVRMLTPVMFPVTYSDGTLPTYGTDNMSSPYARLNYMGYRKEDENHNKLTLELSQEVGGVFKGLRLTTQVLSEIQTFIQQSRYLRPNMYRATGRDAQGNLIKSLRLNEQNVLYEKGSNFWRKYFWQSKAEWNRSFNMHDLGALLYYYMEDIVDGRWQFDQLGINSIPARRQNLSGRLSYGFNNTYFIDANFGYTGSSQFKKGERFGFFPSLALGWVPTGYNWVQDNLPWLSFLKIRGSYGLAGNDKITDTRFPYLTLIDNLAGIYWIPRGSGMNGITERLIGADNLKWEVAKKANMGIEANFFNDNLRIVADVFHDQRDDIFMTRVTLPNYLGLVNLPYSNVGRMHSFGSDGNIEYSHNFNDNMGFTIRGNYTFSQNIIDYFEENKLPYDYLSVTGKPYGVVRGYIAEGLFKDKEEIETSPDQSAFGRIRPGDIKYRDVNGDGRINEDDRVPLSYGNQVPRVMYGFGADYRWKDLTVAVLFRGAAKVQYYRSGVNIYNFGLNSPGWIPFYNGDLGNVIKLANNPKNRWTASWYSGDPATENPNAEFPRLSYGSNTNNEQLSTFWQRDGSYIRLQEISLKYRLKKYDWIKAMGLTSVDLEFVTNNVFTIDKVKFFDPEQAHYNGGAYPIPISYTFQLYLNF